MKYLKSKFLNLKSGALSVDSSRLVDALGVEQDDLYKAFKNETDQTLTADIEQKLEYDADLKIATFTGLSGSDEFCFEEEAHNVDSFSAACTVWGLSPEYFE